MKSKLTYFYEFAAYVFMVWAAIKDGLSLFEISIIFFLISIIDRIDYGGMK